MGGLGWSGGRVQIGPQIVTANGGHALDFQHALGRYPAIPLEYCLPGYAEELGELGRAADSLQSALEWCAVHDRDGKYCLRPCQATLPATFAAAQPITPGMANKTPTPETKAFGRRITERMAELELTATEVGRLMGVSRQAVSNWASGADVPSRDNMLKLPLILDTTADWLFTGRGPKAHPRGAQELYRLLERLDLEQWERLAWIAKGMLPPEPPPESPPPPTEEQRKAS